jgi:hypothetical protein
VLHTLHTSFSSNQVVVQNQFAEKRKQNSEMVFVSLFFLVFFFFFFSTCSCHHFLFNLYKDEHVQRLLTISPHIVLILSKYPFCIEKEAIRSLLPLHQQQHVHRKTTTFIHHVNKDNPRKGKTLPFFWGGEYYLLT